MQMALNVFQHDDDVCDKHADRQRQGHQRHHVRGKARGQHHHKRGDNGNRQRDRGNDGQPHVMQKEQQHQSRQRDARDEVRKHIRNRVVDDGGFIVGDDDLKIFGQFLPKFCQQFLHVFHDFQRVRAAGFRQRQADGGLAVHAGDAADFFVGVLHGGDIREANHAAVNRNFKLLNRL